MRRLLSQWRPGLFFGYGLAPFSGAQGGLGLGSMNTVGTATQSASSLASSFLGTYGTTPYLVALKIDFNTSGANDTVTVYLHPTANSATPGVAATYTVSTFDVGTITGIGFQNSVCGFAIKADEIRVGDSYAEVAGGSSEPFPIAPVITGVTPGTGLTNGGTVVTITGSNFLAGVTVKFGAHAGTGISLTGSTNITATTPGGNPDAVNVVVENTNTLTGTNYTDSGVANCSTYYYVVAATNSVGARTHSSEQAGSLDAYAWAVNSGGSAAGQFGADANVVGGTVGATVTTTIDTASLVAPAPLAVYQSERYGTTASQLAGPNLP